MRAWRSGRPSELIEALEAGSGVICLAGAGGKKSTIYQLVSRHTGRVAITATVHTPPFRRRAVGETRIAQGGALKELIAGAAGGRCVAYACPSDKKARLAGVSPELVADIHDSCGFDVTLVKADGARLRRIKAPAPHEPVVPPRFATLVYLVSVQAVGALLDHSVAHRPETIAELTGAALGRPISAEHVAHLLSHKAGGLKYADRARCVVPVINMVDTDAQRHTARRIADQILDRAAGLDRVVLARMVAQHPVVEVVGR